MGAARLGRYTILKHLASGGMADVLLARTDGIEGFERHVVVKRIKSEHAKDQRFIQMFLDEARVAAGLHHQNIVQVHDIGEVHGEYFFSMEYLHGEDLRTVLSAVSKSRTHMPLGYVVAIIAGVAAGLHYAHERRAADGRPVDIVHRDVSPSNILVGYDGAVKVVDFGIAKAAMRQVETRSGSLKGKVSYMSPEQCKGDVVDRRSDIYSLGVVLYELATTTRLFKGDSEYLLMDAIVNGKVPLPRTRRQDLPNELSLIIMRALATHSDRRYQTADELRVALEQFAIKHNVAASASALAAYMHKLFGARPEPWLDTGDSTRVERPIDVEAPTESAGRSWTEMPRDDFAGAAAPEEPKTTTGRRGMARSKLKPSLSPAAYEDTGVPVIAARETRTSNKFGYEKQLAAVALPPPPPSHTLAKIVMIGLPLLALAGVATWHFVLRDQPPPQTAIVTPPPPAPVPAVTVTPIPQPPPPPAKVDVQLDADVATARVVFRRRISPAPMKTELAPSDIVELVEVSARGYKTERYWLTFDRATHLKAHLVKGNGIEEATEEQTLVALGEATAPAPATATTTIAQAPRPAAVPRRKIGKIAAEENPPAVAAADRPVSPELSTAPVSSLPEPAAPVAEPPKPAPAPSPAPAPPPAAPRPEPPHAIPPAALAGLLASSTRIDVPEIVLTRMRHDEKKRTNAVIKVCIGTSGEVTATSVIRSSGYPAYDANLVAGIRAWRYRPYVAGGKAVPACSAVAISYAMTD
ncbi:MAG: TonB family protein [Acidobacteriota bacterium]